MKERMMIESVHKLLPAQIFEYEGERYIVATLHKDRWMLMENRIYVNLKDGSVRKFMYEDVEVVS